MNQVVTKRNPKLRHIDEKRYNNLERDDVNHEKVIPQKI